MRWLLLGALLTLVGCGSAAPARPELSPPEAQRLALDADDRRRQAFGEANPAPLQDAFRGPSLAAAEARVAGLSRRRQRLEERPALRCVVHWRAGASPELVLEVRGQRRLVGPRQPDPPWSKEVRQWWLRLEPGGGRWWVVEDRELPPDRWWPPGPGCTIGAGMV